MFQQQEVLVLNVLHAYETYQPRELSNGMSKHFLACLWVYEGACCLMPPVFIFFTMVVTYFSFVVFVHVELSATAKKLNGVLTVLVDCFQDFFPVIHGTLPLDAQSFDCILGIL